MDAKRGKVITFYSYKGGTGRSMALANAACLLARRSDVKRILAIDWDLDAPGLHHYFWSLKPDPLREHVPPPAIGILDLFAEIEQRLKGLDRDEPLSESDAQEVVAGISWDTFIAEAGPQKVDLLAAGRMDKGYADRVADFDWRSLFDAAPSLIRVLADTLAQRYDYVLVDSRTGLNDISGICTTLLPDQFVFVFTPNNQSIDGGIDVITQATTYRRASEDLRPLVVFPLQSRLEMSEPQLFTSWRFGSTSDAGARVGYQVRFEKLFAEIYGLKECSLQSYFDEVQIQHMPRYSYGEDLAVMTERAQGTRLSLSRSYAAFVDVLTRYDAPWNVKPSTEAGAELVAGAEPAVVKVNAAKEYINDERARVKLHDLVSNEIRADLPRIHQLSYQGPWSPEQFEERLHSYEAICNDLLHLEAVLAYWGDRSHHGALVMGPKRIVANVRPESGLSVWLAMRWYPAMLLTYAAGIAAVAGTKYENLHALFSVTVPDDSDQGDLVQALGRAASDLHQPFGALPGFERRHTPRSDYLHKLLEPVVDSVVFIGSDYDDAFDRFELLFALEYMHRAERVLGRAWAPLGRYGWKQRRGGTNPFSALMKDFETKGSQWEPLKAGLFSGSKERFASIASEFSEFIGRLQFY